MDLRHRARHAHGQQVILSPANEGICMSPFGFSVFMGLAVALAAAVVVVVSFKLRPQQKAWSIWGSQRMFTTSVAFYHISYNLSHSHSHIPLCTSVYVCKFVYELELYDRKNNSCIATSKVCRKPGFSPNNSVHVEDVTNLFKHHLSICLAIFLSDQCNCM